RFTGFIVNSWNPSLQKGVSDFDTTHSANGFAVWQLPFGKGRTFGRNANGLVNAFIGGWQIVGGFRAATGLPTRPGNGRRWPTNWNISGFATPNGTPLQPVTNSENSKTGGPNLWADPAQAIKAYGFTLAGQVGTRNTLRGDGPFNIDTGVSKRFVMPYSESHSVQ